MGALGVPAGEEDYGSDWAVMCWSQLVSRASSQGYNTSSRGEKKGEGCGIPGKQPLTALTEAQWNDSSATSTCLTQFTHSRPHSHTISTLWSVTTAAGLQCLCVCVFSRSGLLREPVYGDHVILCAARKEKQDSFLFSFYSISQRRSKQWQQIKNMSAPQTQVAVWMKHRVAPARWHYVDLFHLHDMRYWPLPFKNPPSYEA